MKRIAINGFGRIGRALLRALYAGAARNELLPVAINDPAQPEQLAALFARDSLHGPAPVPVTLKGGQLQLDQDSVHLLHFGEAAALPWAELEVDLVFECSGRLNDRQANQSHLKAGTPRVLVSNPGEGDFDATLVYGLNERALDQRAQIVSGASCTSNCLAPVLSVLDAGFGIGMGNSTTLHAAMNDQPLIDTAGAKTVRLARAGSRSLVPVATRLKEGVERILPQLGGRMTSHALRLPGISTSAIDLSLCLDKKVTKKAVLDSLRRAAQEELQGILTVLDQPLVSEDLLGNPHSAVIDAQETTVNGRLVRLLCWFDNEWAFACRLLDIARHWLRID